MQDVLYLEPVGGIAGDMFIAAALDLGVRLEELTRMLSGLALPPYRLVTTKAERHAISATHVDVQVETPPHGHTPLSQIQRLIEAAPTLPSSARSRALAVFQVIGEAEAKIHGIPLEAVEFHEVGAVDSIVDICGAACVLELLGHPEIFSAPPPLGSGSIKAAHGELPIPAPATLEILKGVPVRFEGVGELTTPTGAGLLKALAKVEPPPQMSVERVGYGAGTRDSKDRPNVLRASLGKRVAAAASDTVLMLEANLDDCTPQLLGDLLEKLLEGGALDAYVVGATMKKGRPGHLLSVMAPEAKARPLIELILAGSTTLGVRSHRADRVVLERRWETVKTRYGDVRVKVGHRGDRVVNAMPEFEDCRARAAEAHVPVKQVWLEALALMNVRKP